MSMDIFDIALAAAMGKGEGGGGGTTDYDDLTDKPEINGNQLVGNKTSANLGLQDAIDNAHKLSADLVDDSSSTNKFLGTVDAVPTASSTNPVQSGGVYSALARLDATTGDIYFGQTRVARVMDYNSYAALTTKESIYYLTYPTPAQNSGRSLQTSPLTENENSDTEDIRTETEEPAPDESETR